MSRIVMSIEENGHGQVLGEFDLSEHYNRIYNNAINEFVTKLEERMNDLLFPESHVTAFIYQTHIVAEQLKKCKINE